jgi:hypothetical protein
VLPCSRTTGFVLNTLETHCPPNLALSHSIPCSYHCMAETARDPRTPSKEELGIELPTIEAPPRPPREGDFAGWATVFGAFWGLFGTFGQLITFGSYQAYYIHHQLAHRPPSSISLIGSLQLWSLFFSVSRLCIWYRQTRS